MSPSFTLRLSAFLALAGLHLASPAPLHAEETNAASALRTGRTGLDLYEAAKWSSAFDVFVTADRMAHSPVFVLYQARCRRNMGNALEARALFDRVAHEELPATAPDAWKKAVRDANDEREAVDALVGTMAIHIAGATCDAARVEIDGRAQACEALAQPVEVDPGRHSVVGLRGDQRVALTVDVAPGQKAQAVELAFAPIVAPSPEASAAPHAADAAAPARPSKLPGIVLLGVGGAALVTAGVMEIIARVDQADVDPHCVDNRCPPEYQAKGDTAQALHTGAIITAIAGAAAATAGGIVLWRAVRADGASSAEPPVKVTAGLGVVRLSGSF